jgi:N-terminal acetyltransferase B complex catalytic subunit
MNDLLKFNNINLDVLTETYNMPFYMIYMSKWPESFVVAEAPNKALMGYVLGKAEGEGNLWHGHVSAVTVAPLYRRLGLANQLMDDFENLCVNTYNAYFVDLFVRKSNKLAQGMYEKFGYSTCKCIIVYSESCFMDFVVDCPSISYLLVNSALFLFSSSVQIGLY